MPSSTTRSGDSHIPDAAVAPPVKLRIAVHDYGGYHFPVQLSRHLAARGHSVLHLYCASMAAPRGAFEPTVTDPVTLEVRGVMHDRGFERYRPLTRLRQEQEYGRRASAEVRAFKPDILISANTPLLSQRMLMTEAKRSGVPFVFWLQDLLGIGIRNVLMRRNRVIGAVLAYPFVTVEERLLARSDHVVVISEDFASHLASRRITTDVRTIENWAPLTEGSLLPPKMNRWRAELGFEDQRLVLYAGTLGYKHDPDLLRRLAQDLGELHDVRIVVASEGPGADWLARRKKELRLSNLTLLGYQHARDVPEMFAAADIFVALLKHDAGVFSVPSKVLTSLSAGLPVVAAVPRENLAARVVERSSAGLVVDPADPDSFVAAVAHLLSDDAARELCSRSGRAYAEANFDIAAIARQFEEVFTHRGPVLAGGAADTRRRRRRNRRR